MEPMAATSMAMDGVVRMKNEYLVLSLTSGEVTVGEISGNSSSLLKLAATIAWELARGPTHASMLIRSIFSTLMLHCNNMIKEHKTIAAQYKRI